MGDYTARLTRVVDHGHDTRSLFLARPPELAFAPGQFLSFRLPIGGTIVTRPYTIASSPEAPGDLEILLNRVPGGVASAWLCARAAGDVLDCTGPWGTFTLERAPDAGTVLIAEDTGIAAVRPIARRAASTASAPLHLLYATDHPLYLDELRALPGLTLDVVPRAALVAAVTTRWIDADAVRDRHFFVCGIGAVVLTLRDALRTAGYARRAVHYEKW